MDEMNSKYIKILVYTLLAIVGLMLLCFVACYILSSVKEKINTSYVNMQCTLSSSEYSKNECTEISSVVMDEYKKDKNKQTEISSAMTDECKKDEIKD